MITIPLTVDEPALVNGARVESATVERIEDPKFEAPTYLILTLKTRKYTYRLTIPRSMAYALEETI